MRKVIGKPEPLWFVTVAIASVLLFASLFVPLWKMELVAPQYPAGLIMRAYGYKFAEDPGTYYDDLREINGLNHYIGMAPIEEVTEMSLFIPGVIGLVLIAIASAFVTWKRKWVKGLIIAGFWSMPLFFVADLQFWLYRFGHTMKEDAPLNPGAFTPKVIGSTEVWNFHTENSFEIGFYFMVLAALTVSLPQVIGWARRRRRQRASTAKSTVAPAHGSARAS
jgi:hypothetical protein